MYDSDWNLVELAQDLRSLSSSNLSFTTLPEISANDVYVPGYPGLQSANYIDVPLIQQQVNQTFFGSSMIPSTASSVTVDVYDGSGTDGLATDVSQDIAAMGYKAGAASEESSSQSQPVQDDTGVFYGAGSATEANAQVIANVMGVQSATPLSSLRPATWRCCSAPRSPRRHPGWRCSARTAPTPRTTSAPRSRTTSPSRRTSRPPPTPAPSPMCPPTHSRSASHPHPHPHPHPRRPVPLPRRARPPPPARRPHQAPHPSQPAAAHPRTRRTASRPARTNRLCPRHASRRAVPLTQLIPSTTEIVYLFDKRNFSMEDSGFVELLGAYSAPRFPRSPNLPRSFSFRTHHRSLGYHNAQPSSQSRGSRL